MIAVDTKITLTLRLDQALAVAAALYTVDTDDLLDEGVFPDFVEVVEDVFDRLDDALCSVVGGDWVDIVMDDMEEVAA